jgi:hypothetical protein
VHDPIPRPPPKSRAEPALLAATIAAATPRNNADVIQLFDPAK